MDKVKHISGIHHSPQPSESGIGKTFHVGAVTPIVSVVCTFARKERPSWLTREFLYSTRPLKNIAFAFGLVTGASALTGSICVVGSFVVDNYLAPTHQSAKKTDHQAERQSAPKNFISREIT